MAMLKAADVMNAYDMSRMEICAHLDQYKQHPQDFTRTRKITPAALIDFTVSLGPAGLRAQIPWFYAHCGIPDLAPLPGTEPSEPAMQGQRAKLKPSALSDLLRGFTSNLIEMKPPVKGDSSEDDVHIHPFAADGTWIRYQSTAKLSDAKYEMRSAEENTTSEDEEVIGGGSYAQHLTAMLDLTRHLWTDGELSGIDDLNEPRDFLELVSRHHPPFNEIPLYIGDRNFASLNNMAWVQTYGRYYLFRAPDTNGASALANRLQLPKGTCDEDRHLLVGYPEQRPEELSPDEIFYTLSGSQKFDLVDRETSPGPFMLNLRAIRIQLPDNQWELLYTNLPRSLFPFNDMGRSYFRRWKIEVSFRRYKYVTGAVVFHANRDYMVSQEIFAHLIMDNMVTATIYDDSIDDIATSKNPSRKTATGAAREYGPARINARAALTAIREEFVTRKIPDRQPFERYRQKTWVNRPPKPRKANFQRRKWPANYMPS